MIELDGAAGEGGGRYCAPVHFLQRAYGGVLAAMGAVIEIRLNPSRYT